MNYYRTPGWISNLRDPDIIKNREYIPVYSPSLNGNEQKYVIECLRSTWISSKGNFVQRFEKQFAKFVSVPYAISTSSGTAALFLALKTLRLTSQDEVIVPVFTMIATALAVTYSGAKLKFADCNPEDGNISVDATSDLINKNTKAIIPVHIYGNPVDLGAIGDIAANYSVRIIEDAAEAIGSRYKKKIIGSHGNITCFSTYVNKIVTTGEGGMIATGDKKTYEFLKKLNNYFFSDTRHFWHEEIGYNFRMSNLEAAIGLAQIEKINKTIIKKRAILNLYKKMLEPVCDFIIPLKENPDGRSNCWMVAFRLRKPEYDLNRLRNHLGMHGIETRTFFLPLHLQPPYFKKEYIGKFPNSELLAKTGILLPSSPELSDSQIEKITVLIIKYFKN